MADWSKEREAEIRKLLSSDGYADIQADIDMTDALAEIERLRKRVREVEAETWEKAVQDARFYCEDNVTLCGLTTAQALMERFKSKAQAARREP